MIIDVFALLGESPILFTYKVLCLGYPVAKIRFADVQARPDIGVLLMGQRSGISDPRRRRGRAVSGIRESTGWSGGDGNALIFHLPKNAIEDGNRAVERVAHRLPAPDNQVS